MFDRKAPFDSADYVTRRGHQLAVGDHVVVLTRNTLGLTEGVVVALPERYVGDVADVWVQGEAWASTDAVPPTRRILVNAVNVEPDTELTSFRPYVSAYGAHPAVRS